MKIIDAEKMCVFFIFTALLCLPYNMSISRGAEYITIDGTYSTATLKTADEYNKLVTKPFDTYEKYLENIVAKIPPVANKSKAVWYYTINYRECQAEYARATVKNKPALALSLKRRLAMMWYLTVKGGRNPDTLKRLATMPNFKLRTPINLDLLNRVDPPLGDTLPLLP